MPSFATGGFTQPGMFSGKLAPSSTPGIPALSDQEQSAMTSRIFHQVSSANEEMSTIGAVARYAAATGLDLVDTALSSMPGPNLIFDRGDSWDMMGEFGATGRDMQAFYRNNQSTVEALSGITGAIATGYMAGALVLPRIAGAMAASTTISSSRLWQAGAAINAATRTRLATAQAEAVARGEAFRMLSRPGLGYIGLRSAQGVGVAAFEEAAIYATMNQNQFVVSNDFGDNLFWSSLGLGLGGSLGALASRFEMRQMVNNPAFIAARAQASDRQGFSYMYEAQPDLPSLQAMAANGDVGKDSAIYTSLRLSSRQDSLPNSDPAMVDRLDRFRMQTVEQSRDVLQRITTRGLSGVSNTGFSVKDAKNYNYGQHIQEASHENPLLLFAADSVGTVDRLDPASIRPSVFPEVDSPDAVLMTARRDYKNLGKKGGFDAAMQQYKLTHSQPDAMKYKLELQRLMKRDGEWAKRMERASANGNPLEAAMEARRIRIESMELSGDPKVALEARRLKAQEPMLLVNKNLLPADSKEAFELSAYKPGQVAVKQPVAGVSDFAYTLSDGAKRRINESLNPGALHNFGERSWLETVEVIGKVMTRLLKSQTILNLGKTPTWTQIDAALEYAKRGGSVEWAASGFRNAEEAELASLKEKADIIGSKTLGVGGYWDRLRLNLPLPTNFERIYDPAGDTIQALLDAVRKGATLQDVKILRAQMMRQHGFELLEGPVRLDGNMFGFNRAEHGQQAGEWMNTPIIYYDTATAGPVFSQQRIAEQIAELKAERFNHLTANARRGEMLPELMSTIVRMPEFTRAMNVRGLADDQVTGLGNFLTQTTGELITREFRYRDQETMLSALRLRENVNRLTDAYLQAATKEALGDVIARLNAAPAAPSKVLVNQFLSNTSGWDLLPTPVALGPGRWGFELAPTLRNEQRLGQAVQQGDLLINPRTGAEIVLDDIGLEFMQRFNSLSEALRTDRNRVRASLGLSEIAHRDWYTPPPYTKNKYVAFTFDADGNAIPGGAIIADTAERFQTLLNERRRHLPSDQVIRTREQVAETADIYQMAQMDWIDPGTGVAPGRPQSGALAMDTVNPNAVQDALDWVRRNIEANANGAIRVTFDAQLGIARARGAVERVGRDSKVANESQRNIWDEYEATILGRKLGDTNRSLTGAVARPIERFIDSSLETIWPAIRYISPNQWSNWYGNLAQHLGYTPKRARTFDQIAQQLGPHTPYASAVDYAEQTLNVVRPPEIKKISEKINRIAATTLLRWFEIPHAAMNLIGIITTMPSILQNGRAPVTTFLSHNNRRLGVIDTYKILAESMYDMTRKRRGPDWDHMVRMGFGNQQVAEYNQIMAQIEDRGSFSRFMLGNPNHQGETLRDKVIRKGADGILGLITDTTEEWSRSWAHFAGLRLADMQGITGLEARHDFAHEIANAAIANYNPLNRPEMYQSAFGSMFGLFMSWMQSYNQRLFRWMETGEYASVGRQLGMQSALFGVASMPGYQQLESLLMTAGVGQPEEGRDANMMDMIYAKFGPMMGSAIAHGGLNQMGIVLYTRGDMNYRNASLDPTQLMAGLSVLNAGVTAVREAAQTVFSQYGLEESNRLGEILARNMPNRMMKGVLSTLLNQGRDIDMNGRIVSENKTGFETALRILGLRSSRQQAEIEAFYADKQQQAREAARMETLRLEVRNLMREGSGWQKSLPEILDKYMKIGMRPEHFKTWIQNQIRETTSTRGMRELQKALSNPTMQQSIWRYNAYGAL